MLLTCRNCSAIMQVQQQKHFCRREIKMKMSKEKCIKLYELMVQENGRPAEKILKDTFPVEEAVEIARELNIGRMAIFTNKQLVEMAKKTLAKIV